MIIKRCIVCNEDKAITDFVKKSPLVYRGICLVCYNERLRINYRKNVIREREKRRIYYKNNREKILKYFHTSENKARKKEYDQQMPIVKKHQEYEKSQQGKKKRAAYRKTQARMISKNKYNASEKGKNTKKRLYDELRKSVKGKLVYGLRRRLYHALSIKGNRKYDKTLNMLGCTIPEFKAYLESKFLPGMSWDNYGLKGWQMDHIIPCAFFDFYDPEQQKKCFHFSNIQPMWWKDNMSKGKKNENINSL